MRIPFMKHISWYLVIAMFIISIVPRVEAGYVPSDLMAGNIDRAADLEKIQKALEIKAVSERLEQLGLAQDEIQKKFACLSDSEIHKIALQLDDLKIGQDGLGLIIFLLVIAILIVVVLKVTGHKVIVTK